MGYSTGGVEYSSGASLSNMRVLSVCFRILANQINVVENRQSSAKFILESGNMILSLPYATYSE